MTPIKNRPYTCHHTPLLLGIPNHYEMAHSLVLRAGTPRAKERIRLVLP